ncbi:MAG: SurA N-terminal domain-containing protein [Prevotella sp.]|nr:SurA N-terminal domain-containing protein [Prevotella sp.]
MAALGKIRSKGAALVVIIGLGLFAFIAEEAVRSCESTRNDARQQIGEVLGEKVNVQDFQKLVDEYTDVIKMTQNRDNLTDQELNQVKDMVWNTYVQNKLLANEAEKIGLTVTDEEMQNILKEGKNPMLMQTPFVDQATGRFNAELLKKFLADYKSVQKTNPQAAEQYTKMYNYWNFVEKNLRQQTLAQKYQTLLQKCILSNPVSAQVAYYAENEESSIELASFPYSSVKDTDVKIDDKDLKAKYDELKERFKNYEESRDIKYVMLQVQPTANDRAALLKTVKEQAAQLQAAADPAEIVRKSNSLVSYMGLPVSKNAFPQDIAAKLDSMAVGTTTAVTENKQDNTYNVIKLISKTQLPDSVQYRTIQVGGATPDEAVKRADSIYTALKAGADFEALAKKYGQTAEANWLTTRDYERAPSIDKDSKTYLEALNTMGANEIRNMQLTNGNLIIQVLDRKAMVNKYVAAVIKKTIDFSKDTYSAAYNKFSQFVSENQTLDAMEKNAAKYGYKVEERADLRNSEHYIANVPSTRDALKWVFESKEGNVSPLYECGENDRLLVVGLSKVNPIGYRTLSDKRVSDYVKEEVMKDKKAEAIIAKLKGVNSIDAAKAKGAKVSTVDQVTYAAPVFITETGATEPILSGAVSATSAGKFCKTPVKGNAGVYMFKVNTRQNRPVKYDAKTYEFNEQQKLMRYVGGYMQDLFLKANVVDNRYLFF